MKSKRRLFLLGTILIGMLALTGCGKRTVHLNDYVTISSEGYDSLGTAVYEFDYDAFQEEYGEKIKINEKKLGEEADDFLELYEDDTAQMLLDTCVAMSLDNTYGLSNGDEVNLQWDCDDEYAEEYLNLKLDYSDITYTVEGLEELGSFNPFDYVEISFSGIAPNGTFSLTPDATKEEMRYIDFSADKRSGLKIGDTVTVTASLEGSVGSFIENFGSILGKTEESYTVEGLPAYVTDIAEIPSDMYEKMNQQLKDAFDAHVASSWDDAKGPEEFTLIGNYLLTLKDGMEGKAFNYLYYVYKVTIDTEDGLFTYYWYGYYRDILMLTDGTCSVDLSEAVVSESSSSWGYHSGDYLQCDSKHFVAGFADLDTLFNKHIVSCIDRFDYQSTITE